MRKDTVIDEELDRAQNDRQDEQCDDEQQALQSEPAPAEQKPQRPSKIKQAVVSVLSGNILSRAEVKKQYPYMLFIAFLMMIYIGNVFKMQQLHRYHGRLSTEVKELRAKSLTISSQRVDATRQSQIIKELEARGIDLRESLVPPKVISK